VLRALRAYACLLDLRAIFIKLYRALYRALIELSVELQVEL
jgi:hypothetical protein